jgi:ElaB/YqjD/DUF883 family membrane-anchored ribosome-binding protein
MTTEALDAKDRLIEDFKTVVHDAEELVKATASQTGDKISAVRAQAEESLRVARRKLGEMEGNIMERTKVAVKAADNLVHENPWQSITVATAVGVMLGMLIGRR